MLVDKIQLEPEEKILIKSRRHWFNLVSQIAVLIAVGLLPLLVIYLLNTFLSDLPNNTLRLTDYLAEILFFYCLFIVVIWIIIFSVWTNYYLDVLTITDRRAILVNHKGFFWRNVASFRLERMQDMNIEINGLIATILDYGTLHVETAGDAEDEFKVMYMPNPGHLKSIILKAADNRMNLTENREPSAGI